MSRDTPKLPRDVGGSLEATSYDHSTSRPFSLHATRQAAHFLYIGNIRPMRAHFLYIPRVSRGRALIFFTPERRRAHFLYMPRHSLVYPDTEYCQLGLLLH